MRPFETERGEVFPVSISPSSQKQLAGRSLRHQRVCNVARPSPRKQIVAETSAKCSTEEKETSLFSVQENHVLALVLTGPPLPNRGTGSIPR